jgi:hypothetical protein
MLWGLPVIRHESDKLAFTVLTTSPLQGPSIFGLDSPTPSLGSAPHHVLHVVHLTYLDEMQDATA